MKESIETYNKIDTLYKGVIEAALFTDSPDDDELDVFEGIHKETRNKIRKIVADYYHQNMVDIEAVMKSESLTIDRIGHCVWYAWQGHGVGFIDYDSTEAIERLDKSATELPYLQLFLNDEGTLLVE